MIENDPDQPSPDDFDAQVVQFSSTSTTIVDGKELRDSTINGEREVRVTWQEDGHTYINRVKCTGDIETDTAALNSMTQDVFGKDFDEIGGNGPGLDTSVLPPFIQELLPNSLFGGMVLPPSSGSTESSEQSGPGNSQSDSSGPESSDPESSGASI